MKRGIRNNNPGNIEIGDDWVGLAKFDEMTIAQRSEKRFCVFRHATWGFRAMALILKKYYFVHGLISIEAIVNRWAPSNENDTSAYAKHVSQLMGIPVNHVLEWDFDIAGDLLAAMSYHENGEQPYDWEIKAGLMLAGVEPE